jgi:hypothetical protein
VVNYTMSTSATFLVRRPHHPLRSVIPLHVLGMWPACCALRTSPIASRCSFSSSSPCPFLGAFMSKLTELRWNLPDCTFQWYFTWLIMSFIGILQKSTTLYIRCYRINFPFPK